MENLRINMVQCHQFWEDKQANFKHIDQLLSSSKSSDLVVLPEMFNTGFTMNTDLAEGPQGESVMFLKYLAEKYGTTITASLIFKSDIGVTNRMVMVDQNGIQCFYDKVHLFSLANEHKSFQSGNRKVVYKLKGWNILMQVCYDLRFPVFSRYTEDKPYDVALYIANWPEKRRDAWMTLLKARAIENQCFVVGCNRIGEDANGLTYSGDSMVHDPLGANVLKSTFSNEGVKYFELSWNNLVGIRSKLPFLSDADQFTVKSKKYIDK